MTTIADLKKSFNWTDEQAGEAPEKSDSDSDKDKEKKPGFFNK